MQGRSRRIDAELVNRIIRFSTHAQRQFNSDMLRESGNSRYLRLPTGPGETLRRPVTALTAREGRDVIEVQTQQHSYLQFQGSSDETPEIKRTAPTLRH